MSNMMSPESTRRMLAYRTPCQASCKGWVVGRGSEFTGHDWEIQRCDPCCQSHPMSRAITDSDCADLPEAQVALKVMQDS